MLSTYIKVYSSCIQVPMTKELLNRPQVYFPLHQLCCEVMTQGMRVKPVYSSSPSQAGDDSINAPGVKSVKYSMLHSFASALFSQRNYQPLGYRDYPVFPVFSVKVITLPDGNNTAIEIDVADQSEYRTRLTGLLDLFKFK